MTLAMRTGDDGLARAVAMAALDHAWDDVANRFAVDGSDPHFGDTINSLRQTERTAAERISFTAAFSAPLPQELAGLRTAQVDAMAGGAGDAA